MAALTFPPELLLKAQGRGFGMKAAMPLYGHELTETTDPISAGLGWAVDLTKDFIGVEALRKEVLDKGEPRGFASERA